MWDWLFTPIDPTRPHNIGLLLSWHGRTMVLAWCVALPIGILIARFFKVTPKQNFPTELDNRFWWVSHLRLQYAGAVLSIIGFFLILFAPRQIDQAGPHKFLGWILLSCLALQFVNAWLRGSKGGPTAPTPDGTWRGDHYDMTTRRRLFEFIHKTLGYVMLVIATAVVAMGMWQANAPNWMWLAIGSWWVVLFAAMITLQWRGKYIATYQAIWGLDPTHPGNRKK